MESATADNIKAIMLHQCLKQSLVAKKAGYTPQIFNNMLNGRKIITDVDVLRIATALELEPNDLYNMREDGKK